jgi:hypothetical protein
MHFTMEGEFENKINFLDNNISKDDNNKMFIINIKPTATDIIIPNDSCHLPEHKLAADRYLTTRLSTYAMNNTEKGKENNTIKNTTQ